MRLFSWGRRDAVSLLFALWKKERYEAAGYVAFVHHGIFANDNPWEVHVIPKGRQCPTCRAAADHSLNHPLSDADLVHASAPSQQWFHAYPVDTHSS